MHHGPSFPLFANETQAREDEVRPILNNHSGNSASHNTGSLNKTERLKIWERGNNIVAQEMRELFSSVRILTFIRYRI